MDEDSARKITDYFATHPSRTYSDNQMILFPGDTSDRAYQIVSGSIKVYSFSYRNDPVVIRVLKAPAIFPMVTLINSAPVEYYFATEAETVLRSAPIEGVHDLIRNDASILFSLLSQAYINISFMDHKLSHLMTSSAKERVIYELLLASRQHGKLLDDNKILLNINERGIASRAGLSRETVNRELQKLKNADLLSVERQGIVVHELLKLEQAITAHANN